MKTNSLIIPLTRRGQARAVNDGISLLVAALVLGAGVVSVENMSQK